ncbi:MULTISPECIES: EF-P 5-aminopentanol modification-associated protein YfmF [Pontibacillus]|uniref:Pitrilysin family protein n=1 Tax=Pontibacillus chungwhensis TaxID=265426 RepID=A0ABY8V4V1_9BACI|nr:MULTISPECIES: pitrilysin family protein [Pontibacillus]MCD5322750.1 insulinase family protein [Pontibacillus sp. HN14]WIG00022.1 pitrilysin family protein [Pontibacillus chungwhensis]
MSNIEEHVFKQEGYQLHMIPTKKYKTNTIAVKLKAPLNREGITKRALLPYVLQQATSNYPSARAFRTALDSLYGAVLSVDSSKKGEDHVMTFRMEIPNDEMLSADESLLKQGLDLMNEMIFHPKVDGKELDSTIVNREKQTLTQKLKSLKDDKMSYANTRLIDEMCKEEPYRFHVHGYEEDLKDINAENLYAYYKEMLESDDMDIYVQGNLNPEDVKQLVSATIKRSNNPERSKNGTTQQAAPSEVKEIIEHQNIQQGKLHLGYRTSIRYGDEDYYALQVFNGIFGGFPSSKLFMNVREKHSLAYYAASRFESHKGLLLVFSGIDPNDYDQAKDIIEKQMEAMKAGEFSEEDVQETKKLVINQLRETMDNQHGLIELMYHQVLSGASVTPEDIIQNVERVTHEDVLQVAKKVALDTVYFLTKEEGGNE